MIKPLRVCPIGQKRKFGATLRIKGEKSTPLLPLNKSYRSKECKSCKKDAQSQWKALGSSHIHTHANGLWACQHADCIAEDEGGIG
jgi:hypothetical protein